MITRLKLSTIEQGLPKYRSMLAGNSAYVPPSYESIASATGTGSSGTITFSSIPGTYQSLQIRGIMRYSPTSVSTDSLLLRMNGSSSSVYSWHFLDNATAYAGATQTEINTSYANVPSAGQAANIMGAIIIDIHNYASTTQNKTVRVFTGLDMNTGGGTVTIGSGLYQSTTAITSLSIIELNGNWTTQTQFALYGIKGA